jgi:hypothetical protein
MLRYTRASYEHGTSPSLLVSSTAKNTKAVFVAICATTPFSSEKLQGSSSISKR